jgi:hypothetical protein
MKLFRQAAVHAGFDGERDESMKKALILAGGILNSLFALFHVFLCWQIHQITGLQPAIKALLEMLSIGGTLMIFFLALASLMYPADLLVTRLGRMVVVLAFAVYASRALEEITLTTRFSPLIFGSCLLVAAVYLPCLFARTRSNGRLDARKAYSSE